MAELRRFKVKDSIQCRIDMLRTIKNGLRAQGISENADVGPNTDFFIISTALGNELAVVNANCVVRCDAMMPDSAIGPDLTRQADLLDLEKQPAAGSVGSVEIEASATTTIETGRQLVDSAGLRFEVTVGGNYDDGDAVPIRAISTGDATNHAEGDVLQWATAPPYCSSNATVTAGGLTNGIDDEDEEVLRARVLAVYQNPPGAGNWEHVVETAEESTPSVQKGFAFPVILGAGTMGVAVTAAPTDSSKSRVVASATMSGVVVPFITGKFPVPPEGLSITTVADVNVDVAIGLSLPEAPTASPPGLGGGWLDGTPWPAPDGLTYFKHSVTAVTSDTVFTVDAQTAPTAGVTRISWLSPYDWTLYTALVSSYSGSAGAYTVTIDQAFPSISVGCYVWPASQNAQNYVDAVLDHFALMGPGEKTSNASALIRGFRHPVPNTSWPHQLGAAMLRAISAAGDEVLAAQFYYRTDGTTTISGVSGVLTPQVPSALTDPPKILIPRHISFFRIA
jgi:hypothetical protein